VPDLALMIFAMHMTVASISSTERQALPSDFHWDISALQESGV